MASPQIENGYAKLANELIKALARLDIKGSEWRIIWAVISKTYGWNKPKDKISLTQFEKETGMNRPACARAIKTLVQQNVLGSIKGDTNNSSIYWIQKNYEKWGNSYKHPVDNLCISSITDDTTPSIKTRGGVVSKQPFYLVSQKGVPSITKRAPINTKDTTKDNKQKTITKDSEDQVSLENILATMDSDIKNFRALGNSEEWIKKTYLNLGVSEAQIDKALGKVF